MSIPSTVQTTHGALVQRTIEYRIAGAINGVTIADGEEILDEENIIGVNCDGAAGIFDPTRVPGDAAIANRYIEWIEVVLAAGAIAPVGARISVVDANELVPSIANVLELRRIANLAGESHFYLALPFWVPQCLAIAIRAIPAPPAGQYHRVLFGLKQPTSPFEEASLAMAWCGCGPGVGGGDGGGVAPAADVVQSFDFSTELIAISVGGNDAYFAFSATYQITDSELNITQNTALSIQPSTGSGPSALRGFIKMAMADGSITAMTVRTVAPFTCRPFIEIDPGTGVFTRTFLMGVGGQALAANTTTSLAITPTSFSAGNRIRVGLDVVVGNVNTALEATVEITTPGS